MRMARHGTDALSTALGIIIGVSVLAALYRGTEVVPRLDAWVAPVVRFGETTDVYREAHSARYTTGRVCFTVNLTKLSSGVPQPYEFSVGTQFLRKTPLAVHLVDARNVRLPDQNYGRPHKVGDAWGRRYCGELPGTVGDADAITVSGSAFHRRHPLWLTETPMPPFAVDAVARESAP